MKEIAKHEASQFEDEIYKKWEESVFSLTEINQKPFSIMMPPPNATGTLHLGHATMLALEDTMIRYKRMAGLMHFGSRTDHAAIATQSVVEKNYKQVKNPREELGREKLLAEIRKFVEKAKEQSEIR